MRRSIPLGLAAVLPLGAGAQATWKPEYALNSPEIRAWYQNAELTEAERSDFRSRSAVITPMWCGIRFTVNKTDAGDEWFYLDSEIWKRIPPDIIHWGQTAPDGQPTLFIYSAKEMCFFPGDSGIWGQPLE